MNTKMLTIILTIVTGLIHLLLGIAFLGDGGTLPILFILNGIGYLALLAGLYYLPQLADQRSMIRYGLMAFTAVTIVAYFVVNEAPFASLFGLFDKVVEVVLIVVLWMGREA
ncbi:MAG: hypothetical protein KC418_15260 [Anaerolineales bacterium]|nr:hypothetical protein [Anaerolineales bacterium]MCB8951471.1 hypothetical protein [Ardenticatenales bacterium]